MAKENKKDAWSRFREKEQRRDDDFRKGVEEVLGDDAHSNTPKDGQKTLKEAPQKSHENPMVRLLTRAEFMMEQVQHLYNMYVAGIESTPPLTQRKQLDDLCTKINSAPKNNATVLFRINQFLTKYNTYRDRWEKLLRDIESGKVVVRRTKKKPNTL